MRAGNPKALPVVREEFAAVSNTIHAKISSLPGLAVNRSNCEEIRSLEAGAADQRPIDLGNAKQLLGIGRLDRSAIEDADRTALVAIAALEPFADKTVDFGYIGRHRRQPGADRPNRLIGDDQIGAG